MTTWLFDNGADPNALYDIDYTPLFYAVRCADLPTSALSWHGYIAIVKSAACSPGSRGSGLSNPLGLRYHWLRPRMGSCFQY